MVSHVQPLCWLFVLPFVGLKELAYQCKTRPGEGESLVCVPWPWQFWESEGVLQADSMGVGWSWYFAAKRMN